MTRDEKNRRIAERLFGRSLDGFGIYSANGARVRDRDFDSREEAQEYIDREDERLQGPHKSAAHGINIRPCIKAHPDFYADEAANAQVRDALPRLSGYSLDIRIDKNGYTMIDGLAMPAIFDADYKTCIAEAFLKWIESEA